MTTDIVINALNLAGVEPEQKKQVLAKLDQLINEEKAERAASKPRKANKDWTIILKSETDLTPFEIVGTAFILPENYDPAMLIPDLKSLAVDQNLAAKKKNVMLKTLGDILNLIKPKYLKTKNIKRALGKEWVRVIQAPSEMIEELPKL